MKVVKGAGVTFLGMRRDSIVDSVVFSPDEVSTLERYLRDYERLLSSQVDLFVSDSNMRRILNRVAPRQFLEMNVRQISFRLSNGSVVTGIPLVATNDDLLVSEGETFDPATDLQQRKFTCLPVTLIENITPDIGAASPRWLNVRGDFTLFRTAARLADLRFAYLQNIPPEFEGCITSVKDENLEYANELKVLPRSTSPYATAFSGVISTMLSPDAVVELPYGSRYRNSALQFQPLSFSTGIEASMYISELHDIGLRAMLVAQPPTVQDSVPQNSLGMDAYSLHVMGTWHIAPLDSVGYNTIGLSATIGAGPSFLSYRGRTYRDAKNLTTSGTGLALDVDLSVSLQVLIFKSLIIGLRGYSMYQQGLRYSVESILDERPNQMPWEAVISIPQHSALFGGVQLCLTYTSH
ncbi:MAG: hypothetical protein FGM32_07020 [Candidatus Kapabacteria bacterium]|nr:hypothetical protein [Candidatus Kapabacteria bacterium]